MPATTPIRAIVFDLDGVLVDSEPWWQASRAAVAEALGGRWAVEDEARVKGANSPEWAAVMAERLGSHGSAADPDRLEAAVVEEMVARYRGARVPAIEAGVRAARRLAARLPLAVASSAHARVIEAALQMVDLASAFAVVVSSDTVGAGKPAPDVYLEAAHRLGISPEACLVLEDSLPGVRSALAAGMRVVLVPAAGHPPTAGAEALATAVLPTLDALDEARLAALEAIAPPRPDPGGVRSAS